MRVILRKRLGVGSKRRDERDLSFRSKRAGILLGAEVGLKSLPLTYEIPGRVWLGRCDDGTPCLEWDCAGQGVAGFDDSATTQFEEWGGVAPGEALAKFIRLHDARNQPDAIRDFARKYGVLDLCEHRRDWENILPGWLSFEGCPHCGDAYRRGRQPAREPLDGWVFYARQLKSMVRVLIDLELSAIDETWQVKSEDLDIIRPPWYSTRFPLEGPEYPETMTLGYRLNKAWSDLVDAEGRWTDHALGIDHVGLRRGVDPDTGFPEWVVNVRSLPGLLARDLHAAVRSAVGWYYCDRCGHPYTPRWDPQNPEKSPRRPKRGQRKYCPECREGGTYRAVNRERGRELYRQKHPGVRQQAKFSAASGGNG